MQQTQPDLFDGESASVQVARFVRELLWRQKRPSASELIAELEFSLGVLARVDLLDVIRIIADGTDISPNDRAYLTAMLDDGSLEVALRGDSASEREIISTFEILLKESQAYRSSAGFREMIDFMGRFRDYAPYNNMLVRVQNPSCSYYATSKDWRERFRRTIKEDARPMLILAPMHPVMLVYDLDQTEGHPLPRELQDFSQFKGSEWQEEWLERLVKNAAGHRILVQFKPLSQTRSGFATLSRPKDWKMRIAIHDQLDGPSRFGVLCHELAHILLGHLGTDWDHWWPGRSNLGRAVVEIEAEAVAFIVSARFGLEGSSAAYVSRHLSGQQLPPGVSIDQIAKVAGHIERMARETMQPRRPRPPPKKKSA